jgi:Zn-finger nucleic acid-binding protein
MNQPTCPKCSRPMHGWTSSGVELDHCHTCRGLWFDRGELARHFANLGSDIREADLSVGQPTALSCPRCQDVQLTRTVLEGIAVEGCPQCGGFFLDGGEVPELLGAISRSERNIGADAAGFDNYALGLYIGLQNQPPR